LKASLNTTFKKGRNDLYIYITREKTYDAARYVDFFSHAANRKESTHKHIS
jgi:hypothetical protein